MSCAARSMKHVYYHFTQAEKKIAAAQKFERLGQKKMLHKQP